MERPLCEIYHETQRYFACLTCVPGPALESQSDPRGFQRGIRIAPRRLENGSRKQASKVTKLCQKLSQTKEALLSWSRRPGSVVKMLTPLGFYHQKLPRQACSEPRLFDVPENVFVHDVLRKSGYFCVCAQLGKVTFLRVSSERSF